MLGRSKLNEHRLSDVKIFLILYHQHYLYIFLYFKVFSKDSKLYIGDEWHTFIYEQFIQKRIKKKEEGEAK